MAQQNRHKVYLSEVPSGIIPVIEMKPGQYAVIVSSSAGNVGRVIGRLWESCCPRPDTQRFFALDNPRSTWCNPTFMVRVLEPGEVITISVEDKNED